MMRFVFSFLLFCATTLANAQNYIDVHGGFSNLRADAWNETIRTYNESRFWEENKLPELKYASVYGLSFSGVLGKGVFISPAFHYAKFNSASTSENINLHWLDLGLSFDIYPLEFGMDSVAFRLRPFISLGFAGSMLMSRIELADGMASIDGERYEPYNWPYLLNGGLGLRYQPGRIVGFFILLDGCYAPNARLTDFSTALLGSHYGNASDQNKALMLGIHVGLTFRIQD